MTRLAAAFRVLLAGALSLCVFGAVAMAARVQPVRRARTTRASASVSSARSWAPAASSARSRAILAVPAIRDATTLAPLPAGIAAGLAVRGDLPLPLPTNAWWSGGILEDWPAPLFPLPLTAAIAPDGVTLHAAGRQAVPKAVVHTKLAPLRIAPAEGSLRRASVIDWGDWDVTFRALAGEAAAFDVTLAEGSPLVQVRPFLSALMIDMPPGATLSRLRCAAPCLDAILLKTNEATYVVGTVRGTLTEKAGRIEAKFDGADAMLAVALVAPDAKPEAYLPLLFSSLRGTKAQYTVNDRSVMTTFTFPAPSLMGVFPHHQAYLTAKPAKTIGTYRTVRGTITLYEGPSFSTTLPLTLPPPAMPVADALKKDAAFLGLVRGEVLEHKPLAGDIYGSAKEVLRTAQLAEIADGLGDAALRTQALDNARADVVDWCTAPANGQTFALSYDARLGGIVALPPAFGSEHYNDHHFHYGYLLHAAAIVARMDPQFAQRYGDCMRLLARDIASADRDDMAFPYLRYFDPYAGHSWANGLTRFGDGSNQESVSEAVHAWMGLWLWGRTTGDKNTEDLGAWMLAQESAAAKAYWYDMAPGIKTLPAEYASPMVSILWGGKSDYATFFDGSPEAIHGIQFFPVGTSLFPLLNAGIVSRLVDPVAQAAGPNIWKSSLQLVGAVRDARAGQPALQRSQPIDPGLSRSFAQNWVASLSQFGVLQSDYGLGRCAGAVFQKGTAKTVVLYRFPNDPDRCSVTDPQGKATAVTGLKAGWNMRAL